MRLTMPVLLMILCSFQLQAEEVLLIADFEKAIKVDKWPGERPGDVKITNEWKSDGSKSLKIDPGLMATIFKFKTNNWKGYDTLRMHFNNTSDTASTMGFEIRDRHSGFRERHANGFGVKAGESVVDLDISGGLWRGEENKPYMGKIKTPIETNSIKRVSWLNNSKSTVYLDRIELIKVKRVLVDGAYAFDFGPGKTQVMGQMIGINEKSSFNGSKGYGFKGVSFANLKKHMSFPTPMLGDGMGMRSGSFDVNLKGGSYIGLIAFERGGFWGDEHSGYTEARLKANGKVAHKHAFTKDGIDFLFQDTEIENLDELADKLIWPAHAISEFTFDADNGKNSFTLETDNASRYPLRIAGLIIAPNTKDGKEFIQHHINLQKKTISTVYAAGDRSKRKGRSAPAKKLVVEELPVGEQFYPRNYPVAATGGKIAKKLAVAGQTVTIHLGVYAQERQKVSVLTGKTAKVKATVSYGRYMPQRNYGVGSVWLDVSHYRPDNEFDVAPELSRSVILEYPVPKSFGNGVIKDTVTITAGKQKVTLPVEINVSKVALKDIPIPVGIYMNALPIADFEMDESTWWKLQDGLLKEQVGSGLTALSGGSSLGYTVSGTNISGDNAIKYIRMAQKHGPIHAIVGYGGFFNNRSMRNLSDRKGVADAIDAFQKKEKLPKHYVNSYDEPRHGTDQLANVLKYLTPNTKAGIRTIGWTSYGSHTEIITNLAKNSYACAVNGHKAEHIAKIQEMGAEPWVYNNGLDRYGMGLHIWRGIQLGVKGRMQWIGLFTQGFAFHNLDGREPSHSCFLVHRELGALKTPNWLGVREGLLDARIRLTLESVAPKNDASLKTWNIDGYKKDQSTWTNAKLEESRLAMIKRIIELSK